MRFYETFSGLFDKPFTRLLFDSNFVSITDMMEYANVDAELKKELKTESKRAKDRIV